MAAPSSAGFDPRESDPEKRRAKLLQQRQARAAERAKHERFVMTAADQVAERAEEDLRDISLRQPHLVPELLSLKEQMAQLPMPAWRSIAQQAEAQLLSVQHVQIRQAIAEQNHYSVISFAKPIIKGAIIAADHTSRQSRVTGKPGRTRHRHLARLRARHQRSTTKAAHQTDQNPLVSTQAVTDSVELESSCAKRQPREPARKLRSGGKPKRKRRRRKQSKTIAKANKTKLNDDKSVDASHNPPGSEPAEASARTAEGGAAADDIEVLLGQEHAATEGLHSLSDAQDEHITSETVLATALSSTARVDAHVASPPGGETAAPQRERQAMSAARDAPSSALSVKSSMSGHSKGSRTSAPPHPAAQAGGGAKAPMARAASFRSSPAPTPHQQRTAAAQQRKQQLALQRSRSSRNVHGFDLSAHAQRASGAGARSDDSSTKQPRTNSKRASGAKTRRQKASRQQLPGAADTEPVAAADALFRAEQTAQAPPRSAGSRPRQRSTLSRLSQAAEAREIPPVLSSWQGHVPSQYPLLWGGTRKGLSRWPTVGAGEGLCGVMGQHAAAAPGAPPSQASILRYYAERKSGEEERSGGNGGSVKDRVYQVQPGGVLMSVAATPTAPPRLHGGGTAQGETPHPLTGQAVLPPNVLTRLTPKQRLALGKQQLKQQARDIAALIQTYTKQLVASPDQGGSAAAQPHTASPVRSARPVGANGLFAEDNSPPATANSPSKTARAPTFPLRQLHPFDASFGGVLPPKEQVRARDEHAAAVLAELQQRRRWLERRQHA